MKIKSTIKEKNSFFFMKNVKFLLTIEDYLNYDFIYIFIFYIIYFIDFFSFSKIYNIIYE